jgi:NitT/TauT family transport system permease protein
MAGFQPSRLFQPALSALRPRRLAPSLWDVVIFALVIGFLALIAFAGRETTQPLALVNQRPISLDPANLPYYALRTTLRMLLGLACSFIFTFAYGTLAQKSRRAEMVLIPVLDILQSVPVLAFATFTLAFFLNLFPGNVLGAELASVFEVFTAQAWNMAFSFYQSLKTVPRDLSDVSDSLRLGGWRRFWTLEAPFAAPGLIWNAMMSMSGAWFFVVASEAISVGKTSITLPGIGSYVALAIDQKNIAAIGWAILTMLVVILLYDQLLFRPLVAWSEKFRVELSSASGPPPRSWLLEMAQRARLAQRVFRPVGRLIMALVRLRFGKAETTTAPSTASKVWSSRGADVAWLVLIAAASLAIGAWGISFVSKSLGWNDVGVAIGYGFFTLTRVLILIALASLIWVPVGVWIGLRPRWAEAVQPVAQFLAAFPNNLFFPLAVAAIVAINGWPDFWLSPLMILGTQWYILFNVIAGASAFPNDLLEAAASFRLTGWSWWRKVALPGVFPYYVTGAITASGGSWNASIVAEVVSWGKTRLEAHGLGAYIADATSKGDMPRVVLGVAVMSIFVVALNRLVWRRLFNFASRRLALN